MSDLDNVPRPNDTTVQVAETASLGPKDISLAGVEHMFTMLGGLTETSEVAQEQRTEREATTVASVAEQALTQLALSNEYLVHSATVVFNELRFLDAMRLRSYMEKVFNDLRRMIGDSTNIPMVVKENIPDFIDLAVPLRIDENALVDNVTVSIFHQEPKIEVVIDVKVRPLSGQTQGKHMSFASRFNYIPAPK